MNDPPTRQEDDFFTLTGNTFKLIKQSWAAVRLNLMTFVTLIAIPLATILAAIVTLFGVTIFTADDPSLSFDVATSITGVIAILGAALIVLIASIAITIVELASVRGKKIKASEAINRSMKYFWRFVKLNLLTGLIVFAGLLLFIIPGIYAMFVLSLGSYFLIDKNTTIKQALKLSYRTVRSNWKVVLAMFFVQMAIGLPSRLLEPFGTIVVVVLSVAYVCLTAIIYYRLIGREKAVGEAK